MTEGFARLDERIDGLDQRMTEASPGWNGSSISSSTRRHEQRPPQDVERVHRSADADVQKAYGTWPSPITAQTVAAQGLRLSYVAVDGDDIYWIEGRPHEAGRNALVRLRPTAESKTSPQQTSTSGRVCMSTGEAPTSWPQASSTPRTLPTSGSTESPRTINRVPDHAGGEVVLRGCDARSSASATDRSPGGSLRARS